MRIVVVFLLAFSIPAFGQSASPYTVGAYYYSWYGGTDNPHWPNGVSHKPWLGYYQSASPDVVRQQIDVASSHGINVFAVSWIGQGSSSELKFKSGFLRASNISKIRFSILYETSLRLSHGVSPTNFNDPAVASQFISDMTYLARTYFGHRSYFKIDGRPVVTLYLTRTFKGEFVPVLNQARAQMKALGWDPYFIGDSFFYGRNDLYVISQFDAVTDYSLFSSALAEQSIDTTSKLAAFARPLFWNFLYQIGNVNVRTTTTRVDFQPGVIPQFDARVRRRSATALLAQSKDEVKQILTVAKQLVDSKPNSQKIVWITSWNEWHEGTAIEPTVSEGQKYPGGNFGFDFVDAVSEVFQ
jgi:glycoprotein endo-alpha-1,2-mannosidase